VGGPALPCVRGVDTSAFEIVSGKNRSALIWAERAHRGQERAEDVPYFLHPMVVAILLARAGADRDLVCAGCLHDVLEDTQVSRAELENEFGAEVARLVAAVTKDDELKRAPLERQAELVFDQVRAAGEKAVALKAADLTANMTDLVHGAEAEGPAYFNRIFGAHRARAKASHYLEPAGLPAGALPSYPTLAVAVRVRASELRKLLEG